jgi:hypothetical protein
VFGSGTVTSVLIEDFAFTPTITCTVSTTGGGGDVEFNTLTVASGDGMAVSAITLAIAAS